MKTVVFIFLCTLLSFFAIGQNSQEPLLDKLDSIANEIEFAHRQIIKFRYRINRLADNELIDDTTTAYLDFYSSLKERIINKNLRFNILGSDAYGKADYDSSKTDSSRFFNALIVLDSAQELYDPWVFVIQFDTLDVITKIRAINTLIENYNSRVNAVGIRMGRIISSACLEDDDYVTQQSYTRLELALSDLQIAELSLRNALFELSLAENQKKDTVLYVEVEPLPDQSWFLYASSDLKDNLGAGVLFHLNKVDLGFDAFFVFQTEGGIQFHPKVGLPVNDFHFLAGMLMEVSAVNQFTYEYTGNIFYTNKNFIGGVGFSRNRILFSIGWRVF